VNDCASCGKLSSDSQPSNGGKRKEDSIIKRSILRKGCAAMIRFLRAALAAQAVCDLFVCNGKLISASSLCNSASVRLVLFKFEPSFQQDLTSSGSRLNATAGSVLL
jgi:hypothetical protein